VKFKLSIGLAAIAATLFATSKPAEKEVTASWYGEKYRGKPTASGELFNPDKLTAAHRTLPFGTKVRCQLGSSRFVVVTINDRGPFIKGRELDLSKEAFSRLASCEAGLLKIKMTVLR
jgi:rare lipoprotein A|tara:strand:+ start:904 stop:1257 length:354 start_codon:yes stop_codon:yes gene_type:complete